MLTYQINLSMTTNIMSVDIIPCRPWLFDISIFLIIFLLILDACFYFKIRKHNYK